jgi:hypothetical protein
MVKAPPPSGRHSADVSARLEALVGLDPRETLDKLRDAQQETARLRDREAKIAAELATFRARFSFPSIWEHERKCLLARLAAGERERAVGVKKVSEAYLDEYAHQHSEYQRFLEMGRRDREKMEELEVQLSGIRGQIETGKGVEEYYLRHARLNDGLVWAAGKEMSL